MNADRQEDIVFQIGQSKAIRNAIVRAMPKWLRDQMIEASKAAELGKIKPDNIHMARVNVMDFFARYGVTQNQIEEERDKKADEWGPQDIVDLRGMATALKEGRISAEKLFLQGEKEPPTTEKKDLEPATKEPQKAKLHGGEDNTVFETLKNMRPGTSEANMKVFREMCVRHKDTVIRMTLKQFKTIDEKFRKACPAVNPPWDDPEPDQGQGEDALAEANLTETEENGQPDANAELEALFQKKKAAWAETLEYSNKLSDGVYQAICESMHVSQLEQLPEEEWGLIQHVSIFPLYSSLQAI